MKKCVVMGGKVFPVEVIGKNPHISGSFYVRYDDGGTDSFKERYILDIESKPTISDYLEANKEMIDKTGCKVVTIASLRKFGGLDD